MAGAFLVLVLGMGLSVITALVEFFWVSRSALANENVGQLIRRTNKMKYVELNPPSPDRQGEPPAQ